MKKFALKSAVVAISALAAASAFAAKNLDAAVTANKYAKELKIDADTGLNLLDGGVTDLALTSAMGVTPGADVTVYVRVDLSNGAEFVATPALNVAAGGNGDGAATGAASSGGAGKSFVIYAVSPVGGESLQADSVATLALNAAGLTAFNSGDVTAQLRVYETLTAASNPANSLTLKATDARTIVTFASGLKATITKGALTAAVEPAGGGDAYTDFKDPSTDGKLVGTVNFEAVTGVGAANGDQVTMANMVDEAEVVVAGDFSFVKAADEDFDDVLDKVFLATANTCDAGVIASDALTASKATFEALAPASLVERFVCVLPSGSVAIPAGEYTVAADYTATAAYTLTDLTASALGTITRDGTTLVAPLTNQPAGWSSRLVLTNSGSTARTYAITALKEGTSTVELSGEALSGSIPAGRTKIIDLSTLVAITPADGGGMRTGLQVVVNGPSSQVSGQYQLVNAATGNLSNVTLVEKK